MSPPADGWPASSGDIWTVVSDVVCRWEQAFSADGGRSWETNWIMEFKRQR
jgi:hypothetical protein